MVDCGEFFCIEGNKCGSGKQCLAAEATDCGKGNSCTAGYVCRKEGGCATREQLAAEYAAEQKKTREEAERRKAELEAKKAATRQAELERQRIAAEKKQNEIVKKLSEVAEKIAIDAEKERLADQNAYFSKIMNDPNQPVVARKLAAAILGKKNSRMQMDQTERELAATALTKNITAPYRLLTGNGDLLTFMNDPSQNIIQRRIAALALGKDPITVTAQQNAPRQSLSPASNSPTKNQGIVLNPDVMKDIAKLSPPVPVAAPPRVATAPEPPRATSTFAPPTAITTASGLDKKELRQDLAYALISRDAYGNPNTSGFAPPGYQRADKNWWDYFKQAGVSQADIDKIERSGFSATIYQRTDSREIVIAFRGTEFDPLQPSRDQARDLATDIGGRFMSPSTGVYSIQYDAAARLTELVKKQGMPVVLTGHSLGGALASYAGSASNSQVVTFNSARNPYSDRGNNPNQTNFFVQGDVVGDQYAGAAAKASGKGSLPGRTLEVPSTSGNGAHGIDGIIGGLADLAR